MRHSQRMMVMLAVGVMSSGVFVVAGPATLRSADAASADCAALRMPLHGRVNPRTHAALLTAWKAEARSAKRYGFTENLGANVKVSPKPASGLIGLHRIYRPANHDFGYIYGRKAIRSALRHGYIDEGVYFYAAGSSSPCLAPVYHYTRNGISDYAFTRADRLRLASAGYGYRNIAFYAAPIPQARAPRRPPASQHNPDPSIGSPGWAQGKGGGPLSNPPYLSTATAPWSAYKSTRNQHDKELFYQLAVTPTAWWLGGRTSDRSTIDQVEKKAVAAHQTPYFVLYAIPDRDCGGYSAGGLNSAAAYDRWIDSVRAGIANRPTVVLVEPDAVGMGCLSKSGKARRTAMLRYAIRTLSQDRNTWVYIHAGSAGLDVASVARILQRVGIKNARGFVVNISGYDATSSEQKYGDALVAELRRDGVPNKHYLIDTSRNGAGRPRPGTTGSAPAWCNPPGRAVGRRPTTKTGNPEVDAWIWVKGPGGSDGQCHPGDPKHWFPQRAIDMTQRALSRHIITALPVPKG